MSRKTVVQVEEKKFVEDENGIIQYFSVEKGLDKVFVKDTIIGNLHPHKEDFVELLERPEEKANRRFAARVVEQSFKYPDKFNSNTFSVGSLEEAVRMGNLLLNAFKIRIEEEQAKTEEEKVVEEARKTKKEEQAKKPSLNTGLG